MAADLAGDDDFDVTIADADERALEAAAARAGGGIATICVDLSDPSGVARTVEPFDIVLGALASRIGFQTLRAVIEAGRNFCDICFMPENALDLDDLARSRGVTAVVDCGVAPGMSNLLAGHEAARMDRCERIEIYVGGLPVQRRWPFQYKAAFSPHDVIEEYTRPARFVEHGRPVTREALSEPELMDFPGVGTLEAFNTDGLRSLADTLDVPFMIERTLRYPGHIELMRAFRATGLFDKDPIQVGPVRVRPIDVTSALMFPKWSYEPGEADLTVMRIIVEGVKDGQATRCTWDLLDELDPATGWTSMARTTAFPCAIIARLIASGRLDRPGVVPPELLGPDADLVEHVISAQMDRGVRYERREEPIKDSEASASEPPPETGTTA